MNLKKLSKEKRNQLILVVIVTLAILGGLGFGLIKYQYASLARMAQKKAAAEKTLQQMRDAVKRADQIEAELVQTKKALTDLEADMAAGDLFEWVINTLRRFKLPYKVEIPQYSPIGPTTEMTLLPNFPYKQAAITVGGTGHFHDFGRFLADFENEFPHIRVLNLRLDANPAASATDDQETLTFSMEIVTLVKPNAS